MLWCILVWCGVAWYGTAEQVDVARWVERRRQAMFRGEGAPQAGRHDCVGAGRGARGVGMRSALASASEGPGPPT